MLQEEYSYLLRLLLTVRIGLLDRLDDAHRIRLERREHVMMLAGQGPDFALQMADVLAHGLIEEIPAAPENDQQQHRHQIARLEAEAFGAEMDREPLAIAIRVGHGGTHLIGHQRS